MSDSEEADPLSSSGGAVGGATATITMPLEDIDIIDIDSQEMVDDDDSCWLMKAPTDEDDEDDDDEDSKALRRRLKSNEWFSESNNDCDKANNKTFVSSPPFCRANLGTKKSLVQKLDELSRGSPSRYSTSSSYGSNGLSPATYVSRQRILSSTPIAKQQLNFQDGAIITNTTTTSTSNSNSSNFDSRTFTRSKGEKFRLLSAALAGVPSEVSSNVEAGVDEDSRPSSMNLTFEKLDMNATYSKEPSPSTTVIKEDLSKTFTNNQSNPMNVTFDAAPDRGELQQHQQHQQQQQQQQQNATFSLRNINGEPNLNSTFDFDKQQQQPPILNSTFSSVPSSAQHQHHHQQQQQQNLNATFSRKMSEDRLSTNSSSPGNNNNNSSSKLSRDESSSHGDLDEILSTTSDSSVSHRLNDVGDVQHIAKLQEGGLKQTTTIHQPFLRSATISPSSEHSPSTEDGNQGYYQSEDGSLASENPNNRYQQYSSQDSLPDSPYSSQSLDSQPAQGPDRLRGSMPNLNKIRQNRGGYSGVPAPVSGGGVPNGSSSSGLPPPPVTGGRPSYYGSTGLSRQHNSDPRLQYQHQQQQQQQQQQQRGYQYQRSQQQQQQQRTQYSQQLPPSRGTITNRPDQYAYSSGLSSTSRGGIRPQPQRTVSLGSRQQPVTTTTTAIPRPGSRIPGPSGIPRTSGIPKPGSIAATSGGGGSGSLLFQQRRISGVPTTTTTTRGPSSTGGRNKNYY